LIIADVCGNGLVGELAIGGLGEGTVSWLVDDLNLADVGVVRWVVKSPLVMPMRAPAVRLAVVLICWLLVGLLLQMVLRMDRSRADGSLRTPGLRLVFIRS
jgi:hypothetical protein